MLGQFCCKMSLSWTLFRFELLVSSYRKANNNSHRQTLDTEMLDSAADVTDIKDVIPLRWKWHATHSHVKHDVASLDGGGFACRLPHAPDLYNLQRCQALRPRPIDDSTRTLMSCASSTASSATSEQAHWDLAKAGQRIAVFYLSLSRKPVAAGQRWCILVPKLHLFQTLETHVIMGATPMRTLWAP